MGGLVIVMYLLMYSVVPDDRRKRKRAGCGDGPINLEVYLRRLSRRPLIDSSAVNRINFGDDHALPDHLTHWESVTE